MADAFDLLGDPIPENHGKKGRPQHVVTEKNRNRVMLLQAMGWNDDSIARALGISQPTLKKHYFRELKARQDARYRLKARHLEMLWEGAKAGNVSAIREFRKEMDKVDAQEAERTFLNDAETAEPKPRKLGKKEQAAQRAARAGEGTEWGDDLQVPAGAAVN